MMNLKTSSKSYLYSEMAVSGDYGVAVFEKLTAGCLFFESELK